MVERSSVAEETWGFGAWAWVGNGARDRYYRCMCALLSTLLLLLLLAARTYSRARSWLAISIIIYMYTRSNDMMLDIARRESAELELVYSRKNLLCQLPKSRTHTRLGGGLVYRLTSGIQYTYT